MGPITVDFDSRTFKPGQSGVPGLEVVGKIFSAMSGTTFTLTMSPSGEPLKIEGLSEAIKKAFDQLGNDKQAQMLKKLINDMLSSMGDDSMMQQFQAFGRLAPPKQGPVKIGEKWEHTWSMKKIPMMPGGLEGKGEYELLGTEVINGRQCAKIRAKETFMMGPAGKEDSKPAAADSPYGALLGRMKMEMSSSGGDGIAYVDLQYGEVVKSRQTQNIDLKIRMAADPKDADETTRDGIEPMTMKFRASVSLDLLDADAAAAGTSETRPAAEPGQN